MLVNKKKILLSLILVAILFLPAGLISTGGEVQDDTLVTEDNFSGKVISKDDNVNIERMDPDELPGFISGSAMMNADTNEEGFDDGKSGDFRITSDPIVSPNIGTGFDESPYFNGDQMIYYPEYDIAMTRASDDEPETQDFVNGSELVNDFERVSGTLSHAATSADSVDWYQLVLPDINSNPGGTMRNVSFELISYTGDDLNEFQPEEDGIEGDYGDFLMLSVLYYDPWLGMEFIGGTDLLYDDQDDDDGWVWDGDNGIFDDGNWTYNFVPPIRSYGQNDPDGFGSGFEESGYYYLGVFMYTWYIDSGTPASRPPFTVDYTFEVDSSVTQTNDQAGADMDNATAPYTTEDIRFDSRYNRVDWYKVQGNDMDKLWNISFSTNWTGTNAFSTVNYWYDPWTNFYFFYPWEGNDKEWGTDDDGWYYLARHYSAFGVQMGSNLAIPLTSQTLPIPYTRHFHLRDLDAPEREFYVAIVEEPMQFTYSGGQPTGQVYPDWSAIAELNFQIEVGEYADNDPPEISDVTINTKNPGGIELDPPTGGYYETEFTIEVTYLDINNDEPTAIWLVIDPDTAYEKIVNIKEPAEGGGPKDPFDNDYTDADPTPGRVYQIKIKGEDLRETPSPHQIMVNASDFKIPGNIRLPRDSAKFYLNDTLWVWNDEPVTKNPNFPGVTPLYEDDLMKAVAIENLNGDGMFDDPEDEFLGFEVWNGTEGNEEWEDSYDSDLLHIDIEEYEGVWSALITPKHNEHGSDSVRIRGFDEHSEANMSVTITVQALNDPPTVKNLLIDGVEVEVNNADPLRPVARLESGYDVIEDHAFVFQITAEDTDKEEDWGDLEFSYVRTQSDQWEGDIDVEWDTGIVTFTPFNEDVNAGNSKMVFSVDDHGEEGDIRLEIYFDVLNENDPPQIQIPSTVSPNYDQEDRITINPVATDEDKGDTLTYNVNMDAKIGDVDSIVDQLSADADIQQGKNWDINDATGNFWFVIDDQNIWKTADGMTDSVEITLVFEAVDSDGASASKQIILTLNDVNEAPEKPDTINYVIDDEDPDTDGDQGFTVTFSVDEVTDPDEDELTYRWEFGDGRTGTGISVEHTYANEGYKTVQMWVDDGEYPTEKISVMVNIVGPATAADDDDDDGPGVDAPPTDDEFPIWIIIVIAAVFLILIVVILAFVALRKKPAPAAQQMYPGYDQAALQGYNAQGLPPGQVEQLPPMDAPGLPPAQEGYPQDNLPPADPGMAPEAQPEAPAAAPEAPAAQTDMAEAPPAAGMGCPSCGSPVDPSWFLCPNCKAPLQ